MEFTDNRIIKIDKVINELDKFAINFINILEKYSTYVIVSGYVVILLGRSRATEDIDIIVPSMGKESLEKFFNELVSKGYWLINSDNFESIWQLLTTKHSVRVAVEGQLNPNIELKFIKDDLDRESFSKRLTIIFGNNRFYIAPLELQIQYKEIILASDKDIEDSRHLRNVFKDKLDMYQMDKYNRLLRRQK